MGKKKKEERPIYIVKDYLKNIYKFIKDNIELLALIAIFITAFATLQNVKSQRQQFKLANRAKIVLSDSRGIVGDVNKGIVLLTNKGNLPAENFKFIWKIIHIKSKNNVQIYPEPRNKTNLSSPDEKEIKDEEVVNADMDIEIRYECLEVNAKDQTICLVIAYKYKCHDLKDYRRKELFYY